MTAEPLCWGGVSHPLQLTTGLVIKSVTTSPTLAGEHMLFYSAGKYSVGTNMSIFYNIRYWVGFEFLEAVDEDS